MMKEIGRRAVFLLLVLVLAGCGGEETAVSTPDFDSNPDPPPIPQPRYDGPKPEKGTGNVYGQIMWNGLAAAGLDVKLCQEISVFGDCNGTMIESHTDETGYYLFPNVVPGTYSLYIHIFDSADWIYITDGILSAAEFEVESGETTVIETQSIYKLDLRPLEPGPQAKVKGGEHTFNWQAYPDAAYYEIYLTPDQGEAIFVNQRVDSARITADLPPSNCDYSWKVEAFNSDGVKIAEMRDYVEFRVVDEPASCVLIVNGPTADASVPARGVVLDWEPHPLAVSYKILMWDDSDEARTHILDFFTVTESQFKFNGALTPDHRYIWSVYAYDAAGREIAATEVVSFTAVAD